MVFHLWVGQIPDDGRVISLPKLRFFEKRIHLLLFCIKMGTEQICRIHHCNWEYNLKLRIINLCYYQCIDDIDIFIRSSLGIRDWHHVHPKIVLTSANIQYTQNQNWRMSIPDNLTRFSADLEMSKIPSLIGPELQCLSSLPTFTRRVRTLLTQGAPYIHTHIV